MVIVSASEEARVYAAASQLGAAAFIPKSASLDTMREALGSGFDTLQAVVGAVMVVDRAGAKEEAERYIRICRERFPGMTAEEYIASFPALTEDMKKGAREVFRRMELA